jgi:DNA-binding LytR/AlgR family response regulator
LLRDALAARLGEAWPELQVVAMARNGREAVELFERHRPDICFLDVHMPGMNGVEAASLIGRRAHLVFVTAFDQYALPAFDAGAVDYLMKPVQPARVAQTVSRLQERLRALQPPIDLATVLAALQPPTALRWIRASVGNTLKVICVDDIDYLRADAKYTQVAWRDRQGTPCAALIRTPLKELLPQLDSTSFAQVHRSVVVQLRAIQQLQRHDNETATIHLHGRSETLPVSRSFLGQFRQM